MVAVELVERLGPAVSGFIIQDVTIEGMAPKALAPLCGRLITGVRWLNGQSRDGRDVIVLLETATCADEPDGFIVESRKVERVRVDRHQWRKVYLDPAGICLMLLPEKGREVYAVASADRMTAEMWDCLRWARDNGGVVREADAGRMLGASGWRAGDLLRRLERAGWLATHRGVGRELTPAGISLLQERG